MSADAFPEVHVSPISRRERMQVNASSEDLFREAPEDAAAASTICIFPATYAICTAVIVLYRRPNKISYALNNSIIREAALGHSVRALSRSETRMGVR